MKCFSNASMAMEHPYLSMNDSLASRIPTAWMDAALQEFQGLLPYSNSANTSSRLTDWLSNTCAGGTPLDQLDDASRHSLFVAHDSIGWNEIPSHFSYTQP